MVCPKCSSENVTLQIVNETHLEEKRHGIIYWLCCFWIFDIMLWMLFTIPKLIITIFAPKKYKTVNKQVKTCACQNCGYSWQIK